MLFSLALLMDGINLILKCDKSSRPGVFGKKGVLRNFTKFTGKHLCQILYFNEVAGLRRENRIPVNFAKFLKTTFLIEHHRWLLLIRSSRRMLN